MPMLNFVGTLLKYDTPDINSYKCFYELLD